MTNLVVSAVILGIVFLSIRKIVVEKRKGSKCVGCALSGKGGCHC